MHYMLSLLLIFGIGFAQKTTVIKKQADDEQKIEVIKEVKDGNVVFKIIKDGKTEEIEFNLDDEEAMAKIHEKLEAHGIEDIVKANVCAGVKIHDCKKRICDSKTCTHTKKEDCKKDVVVWHKSDEDDTKNIKIIKKYKMIDDPFLKDENAGFLGVQIQDISEQLSSYFKVKDGNGVLVSEVVEDSPAEKAGLKAGDIITKVDDKDIKNADDLTLTIRSFEPKTKVLVLVIRNGKKKKIEATLGEAEQNYFNKFGDLENLKHFGDKHKMLSRMHPEDLDDFEFHEFQFDQEKFKEQMDEMRKELSTMKEELKKLREDN